MEKYILSVLVDNRPGVLSKITGLLRRKLFQIDSLTVGRTADDKVSQSTIVILGTKTEARKAALMLDKLVEVLSVEVLGRDALVREIVLARFRVSSKEAEQFLHQQEMGILAKEISRSGDEIIVELIDSSLRLDNFLETIKTSDVEILDWVRSGVISIK